MSLELTKEQKEAFERFKKLRVGALFMKQGTGKTRTALEIVNYNQPDYLLYVTPYSTIENARAEIEKWGCCCEYDVVGYETISSSDEKYLDIYEKIEEKKKNDEKLFIIADESIFIKNIKTKRTDRTNELRNFFDYALILNGTPLTRDEWDLYNQMNFLSDKILNMNYREFLQMFFVEHRMCGQTYHEFYEPNRPAFLKMCSPYIYEADLEFNRAERRDIRTIKCNMYEYQEKKEKILQLYENGNIDSLLVLFADLQCIAARMPEKNEAVAEYIKDRQCVCFCNYLDEVRQIQELCDCYVITGATTLKNRKEIIKDFENDKKKPLLIMMGCGSYGLNLQFCNEIVYSSVNFDYAMMEQSEYRIKRIGQKSDIKYTYILAKAGINSMMLENLNNKRSLIEIIKLLMQEAAKRE